MTAEEFYSQKDDHVEKKSYVVQSGIPIGLEYPKVNLPIPNEPHKFDLSDEEVAYLHSLVPGIKIIPIAPVEAQIPESHKVKPVSDQEPAPVVNEVKPPEVGGEGSEGTTGGSDPDAPVTSASMNARDAIMYIESHTPEELEGFLAEDEQRKGVQNAWNAKFPTL